MSMFGEFYKSPRTYASDLQPVWEMLGDSNTGWPYFNYYNTYTMNWHYQLKSMPKMHTGTFLFIILILILFVTALVSKWLPCDGFVQPSHTDPITRDHKPPAFVFRVLREDENPNDGLYPRDWTANISAKSHVHGKRMSQFISTTATFEAAEMFANLAVEKRKIQEKDVRIVKIYVLPKTNDKGEEVEAALEIIDLSDPKTLHFHFKVSDYRGRNYATKCKEVLVRGPISAWRIELVKTKWNISEEIDVSDEPNSDEEVNEAYDEVFNLATKYECISVCDTDDYKFII